MRFDIITILPEAFTSYLSASILKRAQAKRLISICLHGLRKWGQGRHKQLDDKPYGGGPGMVIKIEPLIRAFSFVVQNPRSWKLYNRRRTKIILFSAAGKRFTAKMAADWAKKYDRIIMIAGHYEGVDERVKKVIENWKLKIENLSIGPYVLTGGELPAMVVIDAVSRHIPGVLGRGASLEEKRYGVGVPIYSRPEIFRWKGKSYRVPKVLLSGDHKKIAEWRRKHGLRD